MGWDDLQSEDPDGEEGPQKAPEPKAKTMSGLKKIDDFSFTVTLAAPFVGWPATVGYSGFFPMAEACLADMKACNETPIGNGPYKIEGSWRHNVGVTVVRNADFAGNKGKADKLEFKIYDKIDTGYADFEAGELDIWDGVPPAKYKEAKAQVRRASLRGREQHLHLRRRAALRQQLQGRQDPSGAVAGDRPSGHHRRGVRRPFRGRRRAS